MPPAALAGAPWVQSDWNGQEVSRRGGNRTWCVESSMRNFAAEGERLRNSRDIWGMGGDFDFVS